MQIKVNKTYRIMEGNLDENMIRTMIDISKKLHHPTLRLSWVKDHGMLVKHTTNSGGGYLSWEKYGGHYIVECVNLINALFYQGNRPFYLHMIPEGFALYDYDWSFVRNSEDET